MSGSLYDAIAPVLILLVFVLSALLMYRKLMPAMVALPCMGIAMAAVGGMPIDRLISDAIAGGATRLHQAYTAVMFGAILSQLVQRSGIAESIVRWAAELSGDRPLLVTSVMAATTIVLFTALSGLGGVIMVASIAFPILLAVGVRPLSIACSFLIAVAIGGLLNVANWGFFIEAFDVSQSMVLNYCATLMLASTVVLAAFLGWDVGRGGRRTLWAEVTRTARPRLWWPAYLTPLLPIALVAGFAWGGRLSGTAEPFEFPPIAAMACGIAWGLIATRPERGRIQLLAGAMTEGIRDAAPAIAIMIGIGIVVNVVMDPSVADRLRPVLGALNVSSPVSYVLIFAIGAPLALYRGPLNIWGLGVGVAALLREAGTLPAAGIAAALLAVGQVQGICDPTNTHNVWVADYLGVDVQDILKRTLPYAWAMAVMGLMVAAVWFMRGGGA